MMSSSSSLQPKAGIESSPLKLGTAACEQVDLLALIQLVAKGSREALDELVSRRHPVLCHGRAVSLPGWIETHAMRSTPGRAGGGELMETARDLLYDRFTRLPVEPDGGTDCRFYYRGFLNHLPPPPPEELHEAGSTLPCRSIRRSAQVQHRLTGYLHRHWRLCLREAWRRRQRMTVAHTYSVEGVLFRLWVPVSISRKERTDWVTRNFGPIDPSDASSQERVQSKINGWLGHALRERECHLHASLHSDPLGTAGTSFSVEQSWSQHGLAKTIAAEKANAPDRLRTSIAALGPRRIEQLVSRIFEDIVDGCYQPSATATEFGLHKSTLTRFAAPRWQPGDDGPTPDLWLNTAQVLAQQPRFAAALEEAGLEELVQTLASGTPEHG